MIGRFRRREKREADSAPAPSPETAAIAERFIEAAKASRYRATPELIALTDTIMRSSPSEQAAVLMLLVRTNPRRWEVFRIAEMCERLVQRKLPFTEVELARLVTWSSNGGPIGRVIRAVERRASESPIGPELIDALDRVLAASRRHPDRRQEQRSLDARIAALLGDESGARLDLVRAQPFAAKIEDDLEQLDDAHRAAMTALLVHAQAASGSKPTKKWLTGAREALEPLPADLVEAALLVWFAAFDRPAQATSEYESAWRVGESSGDLLKGMLWLTAALVPSEDLIRAVAAAGLSGQRKIQYEGPRCTKVTNAAVWALSAIDHPLAIAQLAIMRTRIRNRATQKQIDKAMAAVAERLGVSAEEVDEIAVPTYGLTGVGALREPLGDFTASLDVTGTASTTLTWIKPDGNAQKSVPKAVRDEHADELKTLKATAKDIAKYLPSQRDRLDRLHLRRAPWPFATWRERYLDQPIVGTLARRLIWDVTQGDTTRAVTWLDEAQELVDIDGAPVTLDPATATVALWHPIGRDEATILSWRSFFEEREIHQPFKQAHREVYLLTDAERRTNVYSNRFAAHLVKQHQFNALCGARGWRNQLRLMVDDEYDPATRELPEWGLRAEFWVEGAGDEYGEDTNETGTYHCLATDQVRFYALEAGRHRAHACGGGYGAHRRGAPEPVPLEDIPPLVLSEVLRDVDLFVGVASVGNDPAWMDGGRRETHRTYWEGFAFGDLSVSARSRRAQLERLVPRLKIADRCSFTDRFLVVRGDRRTYKIHLGSGNILMEPNDQYLCIVAGRGAIAGPAAKVFLPFEDDRTLSIILSKAFLLAEDTKITDPTILSQIKR